MSRYRRVRIEGGWFFFTVTLADRSSDLLVRHIERLRNAYATALRRDPFETIAICVLPDHLHAIWALPASKGHSVGWAKAAQRNAERPCPPECLFDSWSWWARGLHCAVPAQPTLRVMRPRMKFNRSNFALIC
jgi:REP element-mobilizing transposase RayT